MGGVREPALPGARGPIVWPAHPRIPRQARDAAAAPLFESEPLDSNQPSALVIGPATALGHARLFGSLWPLAAAHALRCMHDAIRSGEDPLRCGHYHLTLCQMRQDIASELGPPELLRQEQPRPLPSAQLAAMVRAAQL